MPISAVIIAFNEARNIGRCLESLQGVADEIVVLDSYSTDDTAHICAAYGVRFVQHPFDTYAAQKNRANALARYDLVLSLDADEALSPELRASLLAVKADWTGGAWAVNRLTNYCGQWIRHGGWYPDRKIRLFDRREAHWGGPNPHETLIVQPGVPERRLSGDLWHYSYYTVDEHYARSKKYAVMAAQKPKKGAWWRIWINPPARFIRQYVLQAGFLDGRAGLTISYIAAWQVFWKYRLMLKQFK
jgi:glycosyltransferase involved in cell wall biosynthesis